MMNLPSPFFFPTIFIPLPFNVTLNIYPLSVVKHMHTVDSQPHSTSLSSCHSTCLPLHRCACIATHNLICCTASHRIALHRIASHLIASHCIASHCISLHRIASHCIALHYPFQDSGIEICAPEVLYLYTDNFDYQHPRADFLRGLLNDDVRGRGGEDSLRDVTRGWMEERRDMN